MKFRFSILYLMVVIALIAVVIAILPIPLAICATGYTLAFPFITKRARWGIAGISGVSLLLTGLLSETQCVRSSQSTCAGRLEQVALALQMYEESNGTYPPAYIVDQNGKPLYSWRVLVLPYLDQAVLFNAYKLDEPWNSKHNRPLSDTPLRVFRCPESDRSSSETNYFAVTGPGTTFPDDRVTSHADIRDGVSKTIQLVEVRGTQKPWAKPFDLDIRKMNFKASDASPINIFPRGHKKPNIAFADGFSRSLSTSISPKSLQGLLTISGGEEIEWEELSR